MSIIKKGTEELVQLEFGEIGKPNEERNHIALRKTGEVATNADGTKFENIGGNYFLLQQPNCVYDLCGDERAMSNLS